MHIHGYAVVGCNENHKLAWAPDKIIMLIWSVDIWFVQKYKKYSFDFHGVSTYSPHQCLFSRLEPVPRRNAIVDLDDWRYEIICLFRHWVNCWSRSHPDLERHIKLGRSRSIKDAKPSLEGMKDCQNTYSCGLFKHMDWLMACHIATPVSHTCWSRSVAFTSISPRITP